MSWRKFFNRAQSDADPEEAPRLHGLPIADPGATATVTAESLAMRTVRGWMGKRLLTKGTASAVPPIPAAKEGV
jgi:hypothetical protein